jgi:hypothetical protein
MLDLLGFVVAGAIVGCVRCHIKSASFSARVNQSNLIWRNFKSMPIGDHCELQKVLASPRTGRHNSGGSP